MNTIEMIISTETLGANSGAENSRYLRAVQRAITMAFPGARVNIELNDKISSTKTWVSNDPNNEILDAVNAAANRIWENGDY